MTPTITPSIQNQEITNQLNSLQSQNNKMRLVILAFIFGCLIFVSKTLIYQFIQSTSDRTSIVACTEEIQVCPDGTPASRTGPKCEFTPCPDVSVATPTPNQIPADWKTYSNAKYQYSFRYPESWIDQTEANDKNLGNFTISSSDGEKVHGTVFTGTPDVENDVKNNGSTKSFIINDQKHLFVSYVECDGPGCNLGRKQLDIFNQILSTFSLTTTLTRETIKAVDVYRTQNLTESEKQYLGTSQWPKLNSFKSSDQTREVYLVSCQVDNSPNGLTLSGEVVAVPNVQNIAEVTLKELISRRGSGFPSQQDIADYSKFGTTFKNSNSGINGLILRPDGTLVINFFDSVRAYGGGSSLVGCMNLSVDLTMKQFPAIKKTIMCIDKYAQDPIDCSMDFQP